MKKIILIACLILIALNTMITSFAYDEMDLEKFKKFNVCENCDLTKASLHGANLSGAYLGGARLKDANFNGANLNGVDLSTAKLKGANLEEAIFCKTILPLSTSSVT